MTTQVTISKSELVTYATIALGANNNNALEISVNDRKKYSTVISENVDSITFEYSDTDYSEYAKGNEEDGSNIDL